MAEIIGALASGVTIAGLLKLCLEAFEVIQVSRKQTFDYEKLCLRLNIERARLYTWGQTMDLISYDIHKKTTKMDIPFEGLVTSALRMILALFEDGDRLKKRYGCSSSTAQKINSSLVVATADCTSGNMSVDMFAESFGNFGIQEKQLSQTLRWANKARWVIEDRTKFGNLIQEVRGLIDGLQDITKSVSTVARQEGVLRYGVQQIKDVDTLSLVSEVCQQDYPNISDAASTKLDVMTLSTHKLEDIEVWMDSTSEKTANVEDDLESMSAIELQQLVRTLTAQTFNGGPILSDAQYDDVLREKDKMIQEQKSRIQSMTEINEAQDLVILDLKDQLRSRFEILQLPPSKSISITPKNRGQRESRFNRNQESTQETAVQAEETSNNAGLFKSLRVSLDDPTYKVLPAALKRYGIEEDWRQYALYIVYRDRERCIGLNEKPLAIFREFDRLGLKPMFMLRKIITDQKGSSLKLDLPSAAVGSESNWI